MNWIAGIGMVLVALLLMWAFAALFISMAAGLIVSAILWLPVRQWRRNRLLRELEQNPALDWQQAAQQNTATHYLLTLLVIWAGCAAGMVTFLLLPRGLYSPDMLSLASGIAFAIALGALDQHHRQCAEHPPASPAGRTNARVMGAGSQLSGFYFHAFDDVCIAPCGRLDGLARGAARL